MPPRKKKNLRAKHRHRTLHPRQTPALFLGNIRQTKAFLFQFTPCFPTHLETSPCSMPKLAVHLLSTPSTPNTYPPPPSTPTLPPRHTHAKIPTSHYCFDFDRFWDKKTINFVSGLTSDETSTSVGKLCIAKYASKSQQPPPSLTQPTEPRESSKKKKSYSHSFDSLSSTYRAWGAFCGCTYFVRCPPLSFSLSLPPSAPSCEFPTLFSLKKKKELINSFFLSQKCLF